jgi:hypothetical protein
MTTRRILIRRDTASNWTASNPTLASGELGGETDTGKLKLGNGSTAWNSLPYQVGVTSVNGNTGVVTGLAPTASPTFTGVPLSTTAAVDTNTTQIATTAYVVGQGYAKLASPTFTGTPTLPTGTIATTQTASNNTTAVATTAYVDTADALKANLASPITSVADASYTLVLGDASKYISFTNADAIILSVPLNASVAFATNDWIDFTSTTSPVIVSPISGVTVNKSAGQWLVVMPHQKARLTKTGTNVWQFTISSLPSSFTEQIALSATGATGTINIDFAVNASVLRTGNATGNFVLNIRGTSTVAMNDILAVGEVATVTFMATMGATPYYATAYQVDGVAITPKWQGGTAVSAGQASSINMYTVTLTKTASATYTAFASMTKFA